MDLRGYRLVSFRSGSSEPQAGALVGERVYPVANLVSGLRDGSSVLGLLREWDKAHPGRVETIFRSLQNASPSHLLDRGLYDFVTLTGTVKSAEPEIEFE